MIRDLTLVLAYYENAGMLARQFASLATFPDALLAGLSVIVVDDGSPEPARLPAALPFRARLFRMLVDIPWNQDACRNLAMTQLESRWALLTDMDHVPSLALVDRLMTGKLDERRFYTFGRVTAPGLETYKTHPNSYAMTRELYDASGGYDERWAGVYGTDGNFRRQLDAVGEWSHIKEPLIRFPREVVPDASTTRYGRKGEANDRLKQERRREIALSGSAAPVRGRFPWREVKP